MRKTRDARALVCAASLALGGCYVQLTAGAARVTGLDNVNPRVVPTFGIAAGTALDPGPYRVGVGLAGHGTLDAVAGRANVVSAGPVAVAGDVSLNAHNIYADQAAIRGVPWHHGSPVRVRLSAEAVFADGGRLRPGPEGLERRPFHTVHAAFGPSLQFRTYPARGMPLVFDVGASGTVTYGYDNPLLADMVAVGGEGRFMIAIPFPDLQSVGVAFGGAIDAIGRDLAAARANPQRYEPTYLQSGQATELQRMQNESQRALDHTQRTLNYNNCINAGRPNCS